MNTPRLYFLLLLFIIPLLFPQTANAQLREIYRGSDDNNHIKGMSFLSPATGYVAFSKNIGYTTDGGKTYSPRYINITNTNFNGYTVGLTLGFTVQGVVAFSVDTLLAYGDFSFEPSILISDNGGQTWKLVYHRSLNINNPGDGITDMEFPGNGGVGYAVHAEGILKTTDRGKTWSTIVNASNGSLRKLSCPSQTTIYAAGGNKVYKLTNGGISWTWVTPYSTSFTPKFQNVFFLSDKTGYCIDNSSLQLFKTVDAGLTWVNMNNPTYFPAWGNDMYFINDSTGFLATNLYEVVRTNDHGKTWEKCKRDNDYQYKYYGLNTISFIDNNTGWFGGDVEYMLFTTNGAQATYPDARFRIDRQSSSAINNTVSLINFSKTGYNYSWYLNGKLISNDYNTSYLHTPTILKDTIQLIVSNNTDADTLVQYSHFNPPMSITSFSPDVVWSSNGITIYGTSFSDIVSVTFGGVPAKYFRVLSSTVIIAEPGAAARSGDVSVSSTTETVTKGGFTYLAQPDTTLPVTVPDTILCKTEPAVINIGNSETGVTYELKDARNVIYGSANGNGGDLQLISNPIPETGTYRIYTYRKYNGTYIGGAMTTPVRLMVEGTRAVFAADRLNALPGEQINFTSHSEDASSLSWTLNGDASVTGSTSKSISNITYSATGWKSATLIATSDNGCKDTLTKDVVYIYTKPATEDVCYANNTADEDDYYVPGQFNDIALYKDDGFLICGAGTNTVLKSRYGVSAKINGYSVSHVAAYTKDGILQWYNYVTDGGRITAAVTDNNGNIYVTGYCNSGTWFHFNNSDSIAFVPKDAVNHPAYNKTNGFIVKTDPTGKYLWHTLIYDPSRLYAGYPVKGGYTTKIKLQGNQLVVIGSCLANLSYYQNGTVTPMVALPNGSSALDNQNWFVLNINTDGAFNWCSYMHNDVVNRAELSDIGIDTSGNTYITGFHDYIVDIYDAFNTKTTLKDKTVNSYGYLLKYDKTGRLLWNIHTAEAHAQFRACSVEPSGNIYVTGQIYCYDSTMYSLLINADGSTQRASYGGYFILKAGTDGKTIWTQGSRYPTGHSGYAIYSDGTNIYTAGSLTSYAQPVNGFTFTSTGGDVKDIPNYVGFFLAKYDTTGALLKVNTSGKTADGIISYPEKLLLDSKGQVLIGGETPGGANRQYSVFGPTVAPNGIDAFYAKLSPGFCGTSTSVKPIAGNDTTVCAYAPVQLGNTNASGYSYTWSSDKPGFSATTPAVTVSPATTTTYYVVIYNTSGIITRDSVRIIVNTPAANAGPDKSICAGSKDTIGIPAKGDTYAWASQPVGFTSQLATPEVAPLVKTRYYLLVHNAMGCQAVDSVDVTVRPVPAKPVIAAGLNDSITSSASSGNQWYIDTTSLIATATMKSYRPYASGYYSVRVTVNGCTSEFADPYKYSLPTVTAVGDVNDLEKAVRISPNPAQQFFKINFDIWGVHQLNIELYDSRGRKILTQRNLANGSDISIASLPQGAYMIKLYDDKYKVKIVKQLLKY